MMNFRSTLTSALFIQCAGLVVGSWAHAALAQNEAPEKPFSDSNSSDNMDIPPPPPPTKDRVRKPTAATSPASKAKREKNSKGWGGEGGGRVTISPGIGFGTGYVLAQLGVSYYFNSYIAVETSGYYRDSRDDFDVQMIDYGPEIALKLLLPNPTVVTPFVGAGPGYQKWVIKKEDVIFDDSTSVTANAFAGLDIGLSRHFSLEIASKTTTYLQDPPRVYPDPDKFRKKSQNRVFIGFKVSF